MSVTKDLDDLFSVIKAQLESPVEDGVDLTRVTEIKAIEGVDNIELAVVGGWNAITKKGAQTVGELVVVATTDALIPASISDSIGVTNYLRKGGRVRTVKLRGVYSECLIIPLNDLPQMKERYASGIGYFWDEGEDLMEKLGIFKYEPPVRQIQLQVFRTSNLFLASSGRLVCK